MDFLTSLTSDQFRGILIAAVGTLGLIWYYVCVIDMGMRPTPAGTQAPGFRQFQSLSVTTISVSLATYVGYVVGIPLHSGESAALAVDGNTTAAAAAAASSAASAIVASTQHVVKVTWLQWLAASMYVVSLVLAVWFYSQKKDETEPAITGLAKSLLGFVAGVFSLSLNVPAA